MGCHTSRLEGVVVVNSNLERTSNQKFDSVFKSAEEVIETINRISGNLSVVLDTFKTVADLHIPPRPLSVGVLSFFVALSAHSGANFTRINLHLTEAFPGFHLSPADLDEELARNYSVWVRMTEELETSLTELEELADIWYESVLKVKGLKDTLNQMYSSGETSLSDVRKIEHVLTNNNQRVQQATELYKDLVLTVQSSIAEISDTVGKANSPVLLREVHRLGLMCAERGLSSLPDILSEFGNDLMSTVSHRS